MYGQGSTRACGLEISIPGSAAGVSGRRLATKSLNSEFVFVGLACHAQGEHWSCCGCFVCLLSLHEPPSARCASLKYDASISSQQDLPKALERFVCRLQSPKPQTARNPIPQGPQCV